MFLKNMTSLINLRSSMIEVKNYEGGNMKKIGLIYGFSADLLLI